MIEALTTNERHEAQPDAAAPQRPTAELPADAMIIVPVRNFVMFPDVVMPLTIARPLSIEAAQAAVRESRPVGVLTQRDADLKDPTAIDMHRMGTIANVLRYVTGPEDKHHLIVQARRASA